MQNEAAILRERFNAGIYEEIQPLKQWVCWRKEEVNGNLKKAPYQPRNGHRAASNKSETWGYLSQALAMMDYKNFDGVGFVLSDNDPYCFVDLDERQENREITTDLAKNLFRELDTITELSPRHGLHFLVKVDRPVQAVKGDIEIYFTGRFMTITADLVPGSPRQIATRQGEIDQLIAQYGSLHREVKAGNREPREPGGPDTRDWFAMEPNQFEGQRDRWTDEEVLEKAMSARNGAMFKELWEGRVMRFGGDQSRADLQLVKYLLYWTNDNKAQVNRLFECSGLMRPKWRDRTNSGGGGNSYGEITIYNAIQHRDKK